MFVKKLSDKARTPTRGSDGAAGLDLFAAGGFTIPPMGRQLIPTDLSVSLPMGTYAHILPRSGLAWKHGIHVGAGVVDCDYRGNVSVLLFNLSSEPFEVNEGDRIAQMVIKPCVMIPVQETTEDLATTARGANGFGSTGST
jgi:deoxyuridine 5'-triphosphate nucleotidohydrolase